MAAATLTQLIAQARAHLKELPSLSTPALPTVTPTGVTGATAYSYKIEALNKNQTSIASAAGSTATGNAALSSTSFNRVTWVAITGATAYRVYRTVGGATTGVVAIVGSVLQLDDTGLVGDLSTAPTAATGGIFWTDAELLNIMTAGCRDMWAGILDLHADHYQTIDETNVTLAANTSTLSGVPADVFRVSLIEPRDTTITGTNRSIIFIPRKYNHPDFIAARTASAVSPTSYASCIYYSISGAGGPVGTPTITIAPQISSAMNIRLVYNPILAALTGASTNPIPGESDQALIAYTCAFAKAKESEAGSPDPGWISIYSTEKQSILVRLTPRQEQEPEVVDDLFWGFGHI